MPKPRLLPTLAGLSLLGLPTLAAAAATQVVEFYNSNLNHYFITASSTEASAIDQGAAGAGWVRTGKTFAAYASAAEAPAGAVPVCRFYGTPGLGPNSHFYTAVAAECEGTKQDPGWTYEGLAFYVFLPSGPNCPSGTQAVYRNYNQRWQQQDSNHRYTTDQAVYNQMITAGWSGEGAVFCAAGTDTPPPAPGNGDCLPAYQTGDERRFRITMTGVSGAPPVYNLTERVGATTTFDGQSALPSTWTDDNGKPSQKLYQQFSASHRFELGADGFDAGTGARSSSLKYTPYLSYPLNMSVGQTHNMSFSTVDLLSGATLSTNTLAFTFTGRESVTVPAGTFGNACKYTSTTQTSAYGFTVTNNVTSWTDAQVGLVKSYSSTTNFGMSTTITHELLSANVGGVVRP